MVTNSRPSATPPPPRRGNGGLGPTASVAVGGRPPGRTTPTTSEAQLSREVQVADMEYALLGWPEDGLQLRLDHRRFSYAGKFVMSNTGKAVAREESPASDGERAETTHERAETTHERAEATHERAEATHERVDDERELLGAVAFNEDRTDAATAWLRYVTVRDDRRGEGVGARLARFATAKLRERGYDRVRIAVNNPFAYHALYKAGFGYTGERTGIAELVLVSPAERTAEDYRSGLDAFRERDDLSEEERAFLSAKADADPPDVVPVPE